MVDTEQLLAQRARLWLVELDGFGYDFVPQRHPRLIRNHFTLKACRQLSIGPPRVTIEVTERWGLASSTLPSDPRLPVREGHYPVAASWHAQFGGPEKFRGELAERLDIDPSKIQDDPEMLIHRHPLSCPNGERRPVDALPEPGAWIEQVEHLAFALTPDRPRPALPSPHAEDTQTKSTKKT